MAATVPTTVMKKDLPFQLTYGTARKATQIYVEASDAIGSTIDLSTYVPGLSALATVEGFSGATASCPTISGTTATLVLAGAQKFTLTGYYS